MRVEAEMDDTRNFPVRERWKYSVFVVKCNFTVTSRPRVHAMNEHARIHERDIILWLSWPVNYNNRYHLNCRLRLRAISRGKCRIVSNETEGNKTKKEKKSNIVRCLIRNVKTNNSGVSLKNRAVKILDF